VNGIFDEEAKQHIYAKEIVSDIDDNDIDSHDLLLSLGVQLTPKLLDVYIWSNSATAD
jgi:hypothetical protein